jgi:hypothetical protein
VIVKILRVLEIGEARKFGDRGSGAEHFHPHNWGGFLFPENRLVAFFRQQSSEISAKYQ